MSPSATASPSDVTRITLGGNPDWMGGLTEDQGTREQLRDSRERIVTALKTLPIGPDVIVITVPVDHKDLR